MRSRRSTWQYADVDPSVPNNAHSFALGMVGHNKSVLELGCAAGHMTKALARQGCRITGVEIDAVAANEARDYADEVITADLEELDWAEKLAGEEFDVILGGDVLEHLEDPLAVMRVCRPLLKRNGYVVVSIPNVAHADLRLGLLQGKFDYRDYGLLDETHLRFFTRASAEELLRRAGLVVVETRRVLVPVFNSELDVDRRELDEPVVESVLEDPEAETYQFVMTAVLDDGDTAVRELASRCLSLEHQLERETMRNAALEARMVASEHDRQEAVQLLEAVRRTKSFRYTEPLRRVYGWLRSSAA